MLEQHFVVMLYTHTEQATKGTEVGSWCADLKNKNTKLVLLSDSYNWVSDKNWLSHHDEEAQTVADCERSSASSLFLHPTEAWFPNEMLQEHQDTRIHQLQDQSVLVKLCKTNQLTWDWFWLQPWPLPVSIFVIFFFFPNSVLVTNQPFRLWPSVT